MNLNALLISFIFLLYMYSRLFEVASVGGEGADLERRLSKEMPDKTAGNNWTL
jgi:hypothetical protein